MPSKNPLYESRQPVNTLRQLASDTPEYQQLMNYLMARSAVPEVNFNADGDNSGQFVQGERYIGGSSKHNAGTASLSGDYMGYKGNPNTAVRTLGHELTHAAWNQMRQQIYEGKTSPEFADAFSKLVYNKKKGTWAAPDLANKLDAPWYKENESYRSSVQEMPAFGIGNSMLGGDPSPSWKPPTHLDPTLATEQMILLDLATRDAKRNPNKTTR